jgi:hypothetical protein
VIDWHQEVLFFCLVWIPAFYEECKKHSPPHLIDSIRAFVLQHATEQLAGAVVSVKGQKPSAAHLRFTTPRNFVMEARGLYRAGWDPYGQYRS